MSVVTSLKTHRLLPVIQIDDACHTEGLAEALLKGGLPVAEVTLRTPAALEAIGRMVKQYPQLLVGAGTVSTVAQVDAVFDAGVQFVVSPGFNPDVVARCLEHGLTVIPGVCTPTDIESALGFDLDVLKFFPAEAAGGVKMLKALSGPYGDIGFVPTGGIGPQNILSYLALDNVVACGGSWVVNPAYLQDADYGRIRKLVEEAVALVAAPAQTKAEVA